MLHPQCLLRGFSLRLCTLRQKLLCLRVNLSQRREGRKDAQSQTGITTASPVYLIFKMPGV
jgi:hypothetical protein